MAFGSGIIQRGVPLTAAVAAAPLLGAAQLRA